MPHKDPEARRAYQKQYSQKNRARLREKGNKWYKDNKHELRLRQWKRSMKARIQLGGKCVICGLTELDVLEFDHIDPSTKIDDVCRLRKSTDEKFWAEVAKCRLLCANCHKRHSIQQSRERYDLPILTPEEILAD